MICSALSRIMPADMIVHGSRYSEPNRVEDYASDWLEYARGKEEAINLAFDRNLADDGCGCFDMGWNAEFRDFRSMLDWEHSLFWALRDKQNGKVS